MVELAVCDVLGRKVDRGFELLESLQSMEKALRVQLDWLLGSTQ